MSSPARVWIDLSNSPHVLFFAPVIQRLKKAGIDAVVTTREFGLTTEVARAFGLKAKVIGEHGGRGLLSKLLNLRRQSRALAEYVRPFGVMAAVSHSSPFCALGARRLGAPHYDFMDYEGQPANHLVFRLSERVFVPEFFPEKPLKRQGAGGKAVRYPGFKEAVYVPRFSPKLDVRGMLGVREGDVLALFRPPSTVATYSRSESDLFNSTVEDACSREGVVPLLVPRAPADRPRLKERFPAGKVLESALPGLELIWASDLVVSAGGTMNREAALLGVPACTVFAKSLPGVDRALVEQGRMTRVNAPGDVRYLRHKNRERMPDPGTLDFIAERLLRLLKSSPSANARGSTSPSRE